MAPIVPHICHDLWRTLGHEDAIIDTAWPQADEAALSRNEIQIVVQVNGKLRSRLTVPTGISDDDLRTQALADPQVAKYLEGKTVRKVVVAGGAVSKLVSVVVS